MSKNEYHIHNMVGVYTNFRQISTGIYRMVGNKQQVHNRNRLERQIGHWPSEEYKRREKTKKETETETEKVNHRFEKRSPNDKNQSVRFPFRHQKMCLPIMIDVTAWPK